MIHCTLNNHYTTITTHAIKNIACMCHVGESMEDGRVQESSAVNSINVAIESTSTGDHSLEFDSKRNLFKWRSSFEALEEFYSKSLGLCDFVVSAIALKHLNQNPSQLHILLILGRSKFKELIVRKL